MGGKQGIVIAVLVLAILVAIGIMVKKQYGTSEVPEWAMQQESKYICGDCEAEVTLTLKDWLALPLDEETGYRKCAKCGAMRLGGLMVCPHCNKKIVGPPKTEPPPEVEGPDVIELPEPVYKCPKCGKNVMMPPAGAGRP